MRMTLTNESIIFYKDSIWIQPLLSKAFKFEGNANDLISILTYHKELDLTNCIIRVRPVNREDYYMIPENIARIYDVN